MGDLTIDASVSATQGAQLGVGRIITFSDRMITFSEGSGTVSHPSDRGYSHRGRDQISDSTEGGANDAPDAGPVPSATVIGVYPSKFAGGDTWLTTTGGRSRPPSAAHLP